MLQLLTAGEGAVPEEMLVAAGRNSGDVLPASARAEKRQMVSGEVFYGMRVQVGDNNKIRRYITL